MQPPHKAERVYEQLAPDYEQYKRSVEDYRMSPADLKNLFQNYKIVGSPIGGGFGVVVITKNVNSAPTPVGPSQSGSAENGNPNYLVFKFFRNDSRRRRELYWFWRFRPVTCFADMLLFSDIDNRLVYEDNFHATKGDPSKKLETIDLTRSSVPREFMFDENGHIVEASAEQIWHAESLIVVGMKYYPIRFSHITNLTVKPSEMSSKRLGQRQKHDERQRQRDEQQRQNAKKEKVEQRHAKQPQAPATYQMDPNQLVQDFINHQRTAAPPRQHRKRSGIVAVNAENEDDDYLFNQEFDEQEMRALQATDAGDKAADGFNHRAALMSILRPQRPQKSVPPPAQKKEEPPPPPPTTKKSTPPAIRQQPSVFDFDRKMTENILQWLSPDDPAKRQFDVSHMKQLMFELCYAIFTARQGTKYFQHLDLMPRNLMLNFCKKVRTYRLPPVRIEYKPGEGPNKSSSGQLLVIEEREPKWIKIKSGLQPSIIDYGQCQTRWYEEDRLYKPSWMKESIEKGKKSKYITYTDFTALFNRATDLFIKIDTIDKNEGRAFIEGMRSFLTRYPAIDEGDGIQELLLFLRSDLFREFHTEEPVVVVVPAAESVAAAEPSSPAKAPPPTESITKLSPDAIVTTMPFKPAAAPSSSKPPTAVSSSSSVSGASVSSNNNQSNRALLQTNLDNDFIATFSQRVPGDQVPVDKKKSGKEKRRDD
jgi:hypothetical protein